MFGWRVGVGQFLFEKHQVCLNGWLAGVIVRFFEKLFVIFNGVGVTACGQKFFAEYESNANALLRRRVEFQGAFISING